ncbi:MAG: DNA recombination protein RmuC [Prevotella sp.]|nr:DNA recombination protein RmuC [Prevotella sp.]
MELVYLGIGLLVGVLVAFFFGKSSRSAVEALLAAERKEHEDDEKRAADALAMVKSEHANRIAELKAEYDKKHEDYQKLMGTLMETQKSDAQQLLADTKQEAAAMLARAKEEADARRLKELDQLKESYETQLKLFKEEMTTATEKLLKDRSSQLQSANTEQMEGLFKPIKENIARMEQSIKENRDVQVSTRTVFEDTVKQMVERTTALGEQADRLSNALQKKNKTAGNWGELILTELLESQGLQQGIHFDAQQSMKDELGHSLRNEDNGARMIPDVVLHLADNRDVIIDSKMSLTAFADYQNAQTEEERKEAAVRHMESVRNHIRELTTKKYSDYVQKPRVSSDFVIMFVPIEGALQLALSESPELWREAFDRKVFLVGGQTLIAALRIIDLTWVNVQQERNTQKIMDEARKLVDRVGQFYASFESVGKKLAEATEAYRGVQDKVKDGRQSILGAGRTLEALGVRGKKALPVVEGE